MVEDLMFGGLRCKAKESHARRLVIALALTTLVSCRPADRVGGPDR
jgi:hypothetical protein